MCLILINERIKAEQYPLKNQANVYGLYKNMQTMADLMKSAIPQEEHQKLQQELDNMQHQIEGV